jgi:hypothetical protein
MFRLFKVWTNFFPIVPVTAVDGRSAQTFVQKIPSTVSFSVQFQVLLQYSAFMQGSKRAYGVFGTRYKAVKA